MSIIIRVRMKNAILKSSRSQNLSDMIMLEGIHVESETVVGVSLQTDT